MKERLDVLLVQQGFYPSRERAKAAIMAGDVQVDGQISDKAGNLIDPAAVITVKEDTCPYVGRGGLKLEKALDLWHMSLEGFVAMDIGASTGGFTDCMLQKGAAKVYAIDVGKGQLAWKLRTDPRVVCLEDVNVRYLTTAQVPEKVDFISIDVSFISLRLVLPVAAAWLRETGQLVCLVKPQFEAGRAQVGKHGIVRDREVHISVLEKVLGYGAENGLFPTGLTYSPVTGAKGNIEFLLALQRMEVARGQEAVACTLTQIPTVVDASHQALR